MSAYIRYQPIALGGGGGGGITVGDLTDAGTDGITVTGGTGAVVGSGTQLAQHVADTTHNGYLSSADWNTFNGKQAAGNYITALTGDGTAAGPGSAALTLATVNSNVGSFSPAAITVNAKGLVTAASSVATGNLTDAGTDGITVTGGTGAVLGSGTSIAQHVADTTHNGYLSSADWNTFNGKQAAGNYITALTGDATASGPGSAALTLATVNANVGSFTYASITVNGKGLITAASSGTAPLSNPMTTLGDIIYEDATPVPARLAGNTTSTKKFLTQTGTGSVSAVPAWSTIASGDLPAGTGTVTSVTFTGDGTVLSSTPSTAVTTSGTVTAALATAAKNTYLGGPLSGSAATPTYKTFTAPTIQKFLSTGTTTGWLFTISTSTTCAVGDTYTNNSNTYTVLGALSAQTGQVLFMSGASAPLASGTLTRSAGAGTASVTFSANVALATYTAPTSPAPLYIRVRMVGGGGGGNGSGTTTRGNGVAGTTSFFGPNLLSAAGGNGATDGGANGGTGGTASLGSGPIGIALTGGAGGPQTTAGATNTNGFAGGSGGNSVLGGGGSGGAGGAGNSAGTAGVANTGGGGGGGGLSSGATSALTGGGGGGGGFVDAIVTSPSTTYPYLVGTGGAGATGGTNNNGSSGGSGLVEITEYYQ